MDQTPKPKYFVSPEMKFHANTLSLITAFLGLWCLLEGVYMRFHIGRNEMFSFWCLSISYNCLLYKT